MALNPCPECGAQISTTAESCPHCGAPVSRIRRKAINKGFFIFLGLPILILIGIASQKDDPSQSSTSATTTDPSMAQTPKLQSSAMEMPHDNAVALQKAHREMPHDNAVAKAHREMCQELGREVRRTDDAANIRHTGSAAVQRTIVAGQETIEDSIAAMAAKQYYELCEAPR
jgi:hypothetical protein